MCHRISAGKTICNRFVCWSRLGVFNNIFAELRRKGGKPSRLIAPLPAFLKKDLLPDVLGARSAFEMVGRD